MKATTMGNTSHTTMPIDIRRAVAEGIQAERPWSDLSPDVIVERMYEATAAGCVDVYITDDDDSLMAVAHIGRLFDIHVGEMVVVMAAYVWPQYRNRGVMRVILRVLKDVARSEGVRWCGYSHMVRPYVQEYRFIDLEKP
ncbi:hypothetical protein NOX27_24900 [Enterobacter kobei]|uniref:N-acetyltransferase domain-containing protein n=1 Tax=Kosakonia virus Kc261 TaxID=2797326 RepID=A0AAE7P4N6_9CAUD|nr:GNAT family N-acetyltransferase [Enterobacter kobei]QQM15426.1 hypothetical protein [Kosakonia virus Kc261]MCQ4359544.1 hypothetical protein [Enterobacter kobei]HDC4425427.1 hypothetical protein [Enterobacter kobei]HDC4630190.1 hypothetical protein [Enterobacter kobei]HDC4671422.1 hypothetical protein [Enterobacter kobei]